MVLLKKLKLLGAATLLFISSFAQDSETLIKKFEESYTCENLLDYAKAASVLQSIYDANSYEINLRLGWLYYNTGEYDKSVSNYKRAVEIFPYSEEAKLGLVLPLAKQTKWAEVEKVYLDVLTINPKNTTVLYRLGLIYYNRKDYYKAYNYYRTLTDLYPFGYDGLLMYAWCNLQMGKMKEAKILFNKVLLYNPYDTSAREGMSYIK